MKTSSNSMKYTDEILMLYLLGTDLSAQQREEIEEAYFRDDATFRRVQELELELVEAHVSGKLAEGQGKAVSDLVGRSPRLQEHARLAEALKSAAFRTTEGTTSMRTNWMQTPRSFWSFWKLASALVALALVVSATASMILYRLVSAQLAASAKTAGTFVLVAARNLESGALIQESDLKAAEWGGRVPQGALARPEDVIGRAVLQPINGGEPIVESRLGAKDGLFMSVTGLRVLLAENASDKQSANAGEPSVSLNHLKSSGFVDLVIPVVASRDCMLSSIVISNIDRHEVVPRTEMLGWWETISQGPRYMVIRVPAAVLRRSGNWNLTVDAGCGGAGEPKTTEYKFTVH
jgi:hypothetical protein